MGCIIHEGSLTVLYSQYNVQMIASSNFMYKEPALNSTVQFHTSAVGDGPIPTSILQACSNSVSQQVVATVT